MTRNDLRNIAIIAHVDHGKTTLVDGMLRQGGVFRDNQHVPVCVMDSNDLERERGITILAKNTSIRHNDVKINIVDTPGHAADFGGEVERVLKMINGVVLLVDAFEGPMPQTRFVLQKALEMNHRIIICINKIDKSGARPREVLDEIYGLLLDLNATSEQLDSPVVYCNGRAGTASLDASTPGKNLEPLFETIISHIEPPAGEACGELQLLVSAIDYSDYVGRLAIGRIERGEASRGQDVIVCNAHDKHTYRARIANIYQFEGLKRVDAQSARAGDIICLSGIENITIGETVCSVNRIEPVTFVKISEPTLQMVFSVNNSPFAGREGKFATSRHLRARLYKELLKDVSLKVADGATADEFVVSGRGEIHLSILIENMRREGYEFQAGTPKVINKLIDGILCEPMEKLTIDVPDICVGIVMEQMGRRQGELVTMTPLNSRIKLGFIIPARGLLGYRCDFMTETKGEGIMNSMFYGYEPMKGNMPSRPYGALVAFETGEATTYGLYNAQERGVLFAEPAQKVYAGQVVGYAPKQGDIAVNVCKKKHVTNMRAAGSDDALRLQNPRKFSLEECIEFLEQDELLEVTPQSLRIRKTILDHAERMRKLSKSKEK